MTGMVATQPTVADVMTTDLVTVSDDETVAAVWELLARSRFHHLPVMRGTRCVGVVDDRALLRTWTPGSGRTKRIVREVLPPRTVEVEATATLDQAAEAMRSYDVDAVPVVGDGRLIGLVTVRDLIDAAYPSGLHALGPRTLPKAANGPSGQRAQFVR